MVSYSLIKIFLPVSLEFFNSILGLREALNKRCLSKSQILHLCVCANTAITMGYIGKVNAFLKKHNACMLRHHFLDTLQSNAQVQHHFRH